ncbi:hypothetical protein P5673_026069 [Acropora cervicornis]|uniref:Exonuclease 1 n=1 Tax=Acropora cervicornis TaxID=6130 RepID=A0AAD9Q110_ACRCE|nr:hypothetical protein P5673_026069 [Acropora cervicornis]
MWSRRCAHSDCVASWLLIQNSVICILTRSSEHLCSSKNSANMGIHCLFPFLQKFSKKVNLREFSGQTACIDVSCWLHKGLSVLVAQSGKREREKEDHLKKTEEANISEEEANKLSSQAVEICFNDITECINICLQEKMNCIVAPYESDAQRICRFCSDGRLRSSGLWLQEVFCHQMVFDVSTCSTVPLVRWDIDPSMNMQYMCGYNLDRSFANEVAAGNVKHMKLTNTITLSH